MEGEVYLSIMLAGVILLLLIICDDMRELKKMVQRLKYEINPPSIIIRKKDEEPTEEEIDKGISTYWKMKEAEIKAKEGK